MRAFILGLLAVFWSGLAMGQTLYTFNGGGTTGDWNTASTWTTDPTGSTAINQRVPKAGDNVVITNSYVVTLSSNISTSITGLNVTVQRGGQLDLKTYTLPALNSLSGQGVLRIATAYFPSVTTNNFDDPNTGTVEFYNWPAGTSILPKPASNLYNNLRLLNTTSTAYTVQLNNDLTLSGNLTLTRTVALSGTPQPSAVIFNLGSTTTATARTLNVQGDINVGVGTTLGIAAVNLPALGNPAVQTFHSLNAYGSLINNGIVNLHNGTTDDKQTAMLTFMGATDANFACNGPTALSALQLNKGLDSQVLLNVTATVVPGGGASASYLTLNQIGDGRLLILVNGVIKFGNNIYLPSIHNGTVANNGVAGTGYYELGSPSNSPTLWVNGATVINRALGTTIYGRLRVSAGTFESITPYATVLREDAQILIEGSGTVNVQKFRPSSLVNGVSPRGSFVITGGLLDCRGTNTASTIETGYSRFSMPYPTQSFRMTGGTIRVQNPDGTTDGAFHIGVDPNNAIVTGGTIEVLLPNTNTNAKVLSTAPLWNLTISKVSTTGTSKAIISALTAMTGANTAIQPLTVLNDFYLDGTNPTTFDANGQNVNIQGTLTIDSKCVYRTGANTTTFSGGQDQQLINNGTITNSTAATLPTTGIGATSTGTFNNWVINKSAGTLTLGGSVSTYYTPASATLSLLSGVLNDGGKTINVLGGLINSASHTSGGGQGSITLAGTSLQTVSGDGTGVFGNLYIANTTPAVNGTPSVAVQLTANMAVANTMAFLGDAIVNIGANRLAITNIDQDALITNTAFSAKCMIQTAGNQSDLGLQKTYGGNATVKFPVGVGTRYMEASIQLSSGTPLDKYGQVSVSPTNTRNPFTTTANALPYYWKVRSTGFSTLPTGGITLLFTMNNADASGAGTYTNYIPARYTPVAWTTSGSNNILFGTTPTAASANSTIRFRSNSQFDGEFTAGESTAFGAITSFYSIRTGNWNANTTWSTSGYNGAAVASGTTAGTNFPGPGNPVFIGSAANGVYHTVTVTTAGAKSGSLVIDRGSTLDVGTTSNTTTPHNFGALPDAKIGGSGRLRVSSSAATATFPGGDFGSFIQYGGGTVEYYTTGTNFTVPTTSGSLTLNQYRNLWLNAASGQTITLPAQDLRVYAQLKTGVANGSTAFTGTVYPSSGTAGNLRVDSLLAVQAGTFRLQGNNARTFSLDTDLRVDNGATFDVITTSTTAITHALSVGGTLVNNGTLDFRVGNSQAGLTFLGSQNAALTSAGTLTDLYTLTLNKGLGRTALLNLDGAGELRTPSNGWLTLTNGTLNYLKPGNGSVANQLTIHDGANTPYLLTDNAGLTVNAPGGTVTVATSNNAAADLRLAGQLRILQGTLKVGASGNAGNDLEYASAGAPGITITGGNLYVNGQIRRTVANLDGALRFDQSGGTIDIDGQGATAAQNNERGLFEVQGPGSIFRMSAGSLNLHRSNQKSPILTADLYLAPDSTVVIGGTVNLGNTTSINSNVTISVSSTVPLYDMQVVTGNSGSTNTGLLTGVIPLTLKGSLTIGNDFSAFNANGIGLNIAQNLVNNNTSADPALNTGGFQPMTTTQLTTFTGGIATQLLTGTAANLTTFGSLTLNTPQTNGTLQLGGNAQVAGTLTLAKGTLNDNDRTITALGDVLNSATHTSDGNGTGKLILAGATNQNVGGNDKGRFGNVTLNNAAGATTTANQEITKVLTLSSGVLTIGSNLLWLSSPSTGAVTGYSAARFIRTNGIVADLGVRKSYPSGALDFTFPVGAADKYTPVMMNVKSNATAGTLTVQPIDLAHPSTTDPAAPATPNKITFYWKVSSTLSAPTVDQQFTYGDNDVLGTESLYKLGRFYNGAWTPLGGIAASTVDAANNTLNNLGYAPSTGTIDGDYTGGDATEFGVVPTFYSRNSTAGQPGGAVWTSPSAWTNNADGSDPAATFNAYPTLANPVVISSGHRITSTSAGLGAANLLLQGTLDLGTNGANNFNTVRGTGTVRIGSALFPAGNYAAFVAPNGGTVDYSGAVQLPARDTYNNLTFSGGNSKLLSNLDLTINGALSLASGTTVDNPTSQNITLTSTTSGATLNGTFNLNDGNLTTGAFLNNSGTLKLGAGLTSIGTDLTNSGTLTNGTGDVTVGAAFTNNGTYSAKGGAGNLAVGTTFTNSNSYLAGLGKLTVNSDFNNAAGGTFTAASGSVAVNGNFTNGGIYNAASNVLRLASNFTNTGTFRANASTTSLYGNFTNNGTFAMGTSLVQFITTDGNRFFSGNTTFYDVQKVGSATLAFNTNTVMTVSDVLTMREGLISTGVSSTLALTNVDTQPIVGASPTTYVAGRLAMTLPDAAASIRTFPVGLGGRYRPVTITPQGTSASPVVLVEIFNKAPTGPLDNALSNISANRYYRIQLQSGTISVPNGTPASGTIVQLSFNTDVTDEEVNVPGNLRVAQSNGPNGTWFSTNGSGVFSPDYPRGYTISASSSTTIDANSFFAVASTIYKDNPLTGRAPLPVQLLSFTATRQGTAVRVAWATATEKNSAYFVVQRSADGHTFADVEKVAAQGTSFSRHDYASLDASPLAGLSYYRLRQVDVDGTSAYSPVVAVRFDGQGAAATPTLVAYPNPSTGQSFRLLTTNLAATGGTVQLFDNVGRLVLTNVATAGMTETIIAPAQPLASGIYIATWQTADGVKLTTKVVVN